MPLILAHEHLVISFHLFTSLVMCAPLSHQAKELMDHLEELLSCEPVEVMSGHYIVEVKPLGVGKGQMVERILEEATEHGTPPDLVLCIGDDRSDEDMFNAMDHVTFSPHMPAEVSGFWSRLVMCT